MTASTAMVIMHKQNIVLCYVTIESFVNATQVWNIVEYGCNSVEYGCNSVEYGC